KVWAHPLESMSKEWIAERVSVIDLERVLANIREERAELRWGPKNTFKYPLYGGTGGLYARFWPLLRDHIQLNREVVRVDVSERVLRFADGGEANYDVLISAAPIPELLRMIRPAPELLIEAAH